MIAFLSGEIIKKLEKSIIISNGNVGYEVITGSGIMAESKEKDLIELFIHTHVREAEISLYGFKTADELELFRKMISISGIGPRIGMDFLCIPEKQLKTAIAKEDSDFLTQIPGIGKKTAKRLILELKEKITINDDLVELTRDHQSVNDDVYMALKNLGYQNYDIRKTLRELPADLTDSEDVIKYFLKNV